MFAALLGFFAIGLSLVLFVLALRHLGCSDRRLFFARTLIGALIPLGLGDPFTPNLAMIGPLAAPHGKT
jgi:hypothetical protein